MAWINDAEMAVMPAPDYLIDEILVSGTAAALVGASGLGKTFVALDIAFAVATGTPWHGFGVRQGSVAYILAEGLGGLRQRVLAWRLDRQMPDGVPAGVHFWDKAVQLAHFPDRAEFLVQLNTIKPKPALIVVDTLARCFVGMDENAAGDMGKFVEGVDTLRAGGTTVLVVHHEGHTPGRERGSSALRGAVDAIIYAEKAEHPRGLLLRSLKQREGEPWEPLELRMRQVELPDESTSVVLDDAPIAAMNAVMPEHWSQAVLVLGQRFPNGATSTEWKKATGLSKAAFHRMRREVLARGFVVQIGDLFSRREI